MKLDYYYDDPLLDYYDVSKDELELDLELIERARLGYISDVIKYHKLISIDAAYFKLRDYARMKVDQCDITIRNIKRELELL